MLIYSNCPKCSFHNTHSVSFEFLTHTFHKRVCCENCYAYYDLYVIKDKSKILLNEKQEEKINIYNRSHRKG